jgi:transcription elongation factor GreA
LHQGLFFRIIAATGKPTLYGDGCQLAADGSFYWIIDGIGAKTMSNLHEHSNKTVVSVEGMKKLEEKLQYLSTIRRAEVAEQIAVARGFGDLSENAEYDEAKNEQSRLEAEIVDLENTIRTALVIDDSEVATDRVNFGTTVRVFDVELDEEVEYTIVGARESDPLNNRISNESPMGAALLGKKKGQTVKVNAPGGIITLKIRDIQHKK